MENVDWDLNRESGVPDKETGFLDFAGNPFKPGHKKYFLELLVKHNGNRYRALKETGIPNIGYKRCLSAHMRVDKRFRDAVEDVFFRLVSDLEAVMFERGKDPRGTADRGRFLEAFDPDRYKPKKPLVGEKPPAKTKVDELYERMKAQGRLPAGPEEVS